MKKSELKNLIKEAVKETFQEELKEIVTEALKSTSSQPKTSSLPAYDRQKISEQIFGGQTLTTSNNLNQFNPAGAMAGGDLPPGELSMEQILSITNPK